MSRVSQAARSPEPIEEKGIPVYRGIIEMSAIPAQTARRGESVEQPPVATG